MDIIYIIRVRINVSAFSTLIDKVKCIYSLSNDALIHRTITLKKDKDTEGVVNYF